MRDNFSSVNFSSTNLTWSWIIFKDPGPYRAVYTPSQLYQSTNMVMSRDQNAGRIHSVRIDNSTFEMVEEFKYLGTNLTS